MDTSLSLLERLRQSDQQDDWAHFVRLYAPLLRLWSRRLGLQDPDAADLVQDVLLTLVKKMPDFQHNGSGSFRNWLYTVMLNQHRMRLRRRALPTAPEVAVDHLPGPEETHQLEEDEYRRHVVHRALQLMKTEFSESIWKACWEHVVNEKPAATVAADLGISVGTVYVAKARVLTRLRQELNGLLD